MNGRLSSANDGAFVICDGLMMISVASRMSSSRSPFAVFMIAAIKSNDEAVNYVLMMMTFRAAVLGHLMADQNALQPTCAECASGKRGSRRKVLINKLITRLAIFV